ncbi:hypothetical protein PsorP6_018087 [Peronosclerospora sorghi]|uniref:Uncharacterized protein n=1 Tax=Peronosclerospora sorghi TaxID=230839 RepID=A0ACC0WC58_9STRA|nr:hypothetical protein PsorP6_018087 [Peronosclerospora sorghi]
MGNSSLTARRLSPKAREATKRFDEDEMGLLRGTLQGLVPEKDDVRVEKATFLKCFPIRGLLGERLFEVMDKDGSGSIHYHEVVDDLAILFRGSRREKLKFILICMISARAFVGGFFSGLVLPSLPPTNAFIP